MVHASFVQTGTFTDVNGIINIKTAVYKPLTNGLAENMVKTFKTYLKTCEGGDIQKKLDRFLFKYIGILLMSLLGLILQS